MQTAPMSSASAAIASPESEAKLKAEEIAAEQAAIVQASAQPQSSADLKIERPVLAQSAMAMSSGVSASTATTDETKQKAEQKAAAKVKQRLQEIQQLLEKAIKEGVTKIYLFWRNIGDEGAKIVATALQSPNCKLTYIDLWDNNIGPEGAAAIATAMQSSNCKLTEIGLGNNNIGSEGAAAIATALQSPNCKLTEIGLWDNNIGSEGAAAIATALQNPNCKLTTIDLSGNNIGPEGATAIATALQNPNCKLTTIDLGGNNIGPEGARAIAQAVVFRRKANRPINVYGVDNLDILVAAIEKEDKEREEKLKLEQAATEQAPAKSEEKVQPQPQADLKIERPVLAQSAMAMSSGVSASTATADEAKQKAEEEKKSKAEQEAAAEAKQRLQEIQQLVEKAIKEGATTLDLYRKNIGVEEAKIVTTALQNHDCKLTSIDFFQNNIGPKSARAIAAALQHPNCKLTSINLSDNNIGIEGAIAIATALQNSNCKLTSINLSWNRIGSEGTRAIVATLQNHNCKLTSISLWNNNIGTEGATAIATTLQNPNCKFTSIDLGNNNIGTEGVRSIVTALQHPNCKLTSINFGLNNIDPEGARAIAAALKHPNCNLTSINLRWNNIGPEGAATIATALQNPNCKLTSIDLDSNNIEPEGIRAIAAALQNPNCKLTSIYLHGNNIEPEGARAIAKAVAYRKKIGHPIQVFGIDNLDALVVKIEAETEALQFIEKIIESGTKELDLSQENVGVEKFAAIAAALQNPDCKLTALNISFNDIGNESTIAIAAALQNPNCKLRRINFRWSNIGAEGARAIASALAFQKKAGNPIEVIVTPNLDVLVAEAKKEDQEYKAKESQEQKAQQQEDHKKEDAVSSVRLNAALSDAENRIQQRRKEMDTELKSADIDTKLDYVRSAMGSWENVADALRNSEVEISTLLFWIKTLDAKHQNKFPLSYIDRILMEYPPESIIYQNSMDKNYEYLAKNLWCRINMVLFERIRILQKECAISPERFEPILVVFLDNLGQRGFGNLLHEIMPNIIKQYVADHSLPIESSVNIALEQHIPKDMLPTITKASATTESTPKQAENAITAEDKKSSALIATTIKNVTPLFREALNFDESNIRTLTSTLQKRISREAYGRYISIIFGATFRDRINDNVRQIVVKNLLNIAVECLHLNMENFLQQTSGAERTRRIAMLREFWQGREFTGRGFTATLIDCANRAVSGLNPIAIFREKINKDLQSNFKRLLDEAAENDQEEKQKIEQAAVAAEPQPSQASGPESNQLVLPQPEQKLTEEAQRLLSITSAADAAGQFAIGQHYERGTAGFPQDERQAVAHYGIAAAYGNARAHYRLAQCYELNLLGVVEDLQKAFDFYKIAANDGDSDAQYALGFIYEWKWARLDLSRDEHERKAYDYYAMSAEQNNPAGQFAIGMCYEKGLLGVAQNTVRALQYYNLAAQQGHTGAQEKLKDVKFAKLMAEEQERKIVEAKAHEEKLKAEQAAVIVQAPVKSEEKASSQPQSATDLKIERPVLAQSAMAISADVSASTSTADEAKRKAEEEAAAEAKQRLQEIQQLVEKAIKEDATMLDLYRKNIGDEEAKIVATALQNPNYKLTTIYLGYNNIGPKGAAAIATALQNLNCKLTSIGLWDNNIGPEGAAAIATALQNPNCKLISIGLAENNIGPGGSRALAQAVVSRKKAGRPIEVTGVDNLNTLVTEIEEQERKEQEQKIKKATAVAQENLVKAERSIVAERDLKSALQILVRDLQPQTPAQTLQQLADLVAIVTPPISQALDEAQLKEVAAAFAKTIASIRNDFPYQAALLEAQFNLGMSRQLYDDQNATEASLKQAAGFANQALQALQAINLGAERKDSKIARKNCKLGETHRLIGDINYKMSSYSQAYREQAINAYKAALEILPNDQIAAAQLAALSARSTFVTRDTKKTGESSAEQMERLTEDFPI